MAWRLRGTGLVNNLLARFIIWGVPVGTAVYFCTMNPWYGLASIPLAGIGASPGYWGDFDLMQQKNRTFINYAELSVMGMFRLYPLLVAATLAHANLILYPGVLAGILFVPCYLLGIQIAKVLSLPLLRSFSEWGEFLFGGFLLTGLVVGLLW